MKNIQICAVIVAFVAPISAAFVSAAYDYWWIQGPDLQNYCPEDIKARILVDRSSFDADEAANSLAVSSQIFLTSVKSRFAAGMDKLTESENVKFSENPAEIKKQDCNFIAMDADIGLMELHFPRLANKMRDFGKCTHKLMRTSDLREVRKVIEKRQKILRSVRLRAI